MKRFVYIMSGIFLVAMAIVIGVRMSADAMAVIIGVVFGLVATIPTTVILLLFLRQRDNQQQMHQRQMGQYPPVVVVNSPPGGNGMSGLNNQPLLPSPSERSFKVVGQDATPTESMSDAFNLRSIWDE